ncbi:MAG TPA: hypothetical protein VNX68_12205, partial [Nitrosopumilaceae archaeon]|nr:hypothetical protein [Nitrosopumilaceae archaeon]
SALPLISTLKSDQYADGKREYALRNEKNLPAITLSEMINFIAADNGTNIVRVENNEPVYYFPSTSVNFICKSTKFPGYENMQLMDTINIRLNKSYITKSEIMVLDFISNNYSQRPFYYATTVGNDAFAYVDKYCWNEGFAYRLAPYIATNETSTAIASDIMYKNLMEIFTYPSSTKTDENSSRFVSNYRIQFATLATQFINDNKKELAEKLLDKCQLLFPPEKGNFDEGTCYMINVYCQLNLNTKAEKLAETEYPKLQKYIQLLKTRKKGSPDNLSEKKRLVYTTEYIANSLEQHGAGNLAKKYRSLIAESNKE